MKNPSKRVWVELIVAFIITRSILLATGWFSQYFPINPNRPAEYISRGYAASPIRSLDIWVRADSFYYLSIMSQDYFTRGNLQETQSNWAFFPLYPYLLKPILLLVFDIAKDFNWVLAVGIGITNLFLLAAIFLLYKLIKHEFSDEELARRSIWLLLTFPTSFFLSSLYSESLFLLLAITGLYAIALKKWPVAALIANLIAVTKSLGLIYWVILFISYDWKHTKWKDIAWFAIAPLTLSIFMFKSYWSTGNAMAPFIAQSAWGKSLSWPWLTFINESYQLPAYLYFERFLAIAFLISIPVMLSKLPKLLAFFGVLIMVPIFISGSLMAFGRHMIMDISLIITIALVAKSKSANLLTNLMFMFTQVIIMVGWVQYYNIW